MSIVYLVRGLPGSGKSTYAKSLGILHLEADMYHMRNGIYDWKPTNVHDSHVWCYNAFKTAVLKGMDVAVSNTFTKMTEMRDYLTYAMQHSYDIKVIRCVANYGNIHNVPENTLEKMKNRFEDYEGEIIYGTNSIA